MKNHGWGMGFMCCSCLPVPEQEHGMDPFGKGARCAGQGWTWVKTELCWAGQGGTELPTRGSCCAAQMWGTGMSRVLSAAFCVMEEREPHSLTHCAKVYCARVVTSSSPPSPHLFLSICQITWFGKQLIVHCMTLMFDISFLFQFKKI